MSTTELQTKPLIGQSLSNAGLGLMDENGLRSVIAEHGLAEATRRVKSTVEVTAMRLADDRDKLKPSS